MVENRNTDQIHQNLFKRVLNLSKLRLRPFFLKSSPTSRVHSLQGDADSDDFLEREESSLNKGGLLSLNLVIA